MSGPGALRAGILVCAALLTIFFTLPAGAQPATTYEVRKGDGLFAISSRLRYPGATRFQIAVAIFQANEDAFPGGNINLLREGQVLKLPTSEQVAAIKPADASQTWQSLIARPTAPPAAVAAVKPAPAAPAKPIVAPPPTPEAAARRYREGLALERKGDDEGALKAFLESGEAGYGLAQRKLGQIYDTGNSAVKRDFQASVRWYQKAREQGVEIDRPLPRMTTK
jgi:pilus assembly protein FimV